MNLFDLMKSTDSREVLFFNEPSVSLKAILAINNSRLKPVICTCRIFDYRDFTRAVEDTLTAAAYNTYSAALMHRDVGGGSITLIGDPDVVKSEMYFRALGSFIERFNGRILLAPESGITAHDLLDVKRETDYVLGLPKIYGGSGDTSLSTAKGVVWGIKAAVKNAMQIESLKNIKVVVQGAGLVGKAIIDILRSEGAEVVVTDLKYDKIKEIQDKYPDIVSVKPGDVFRVDCDVFCSCAFASLINKDNLDRLKCKVLTGSVSRILADDVLDRELKKKRILFIPGFVVNSGEIIQISNELLGYGPEKTEKEIKDIYYNTLNIIQLASKKKVSITRLALDLASDYIEKVTAIKMLK